MSPILPRPLHIAARIVLASAGSYWVSALAAGTVPLYAGGVNQCRLRRHPPRHHAAAAGISVGVGGAAAADGVLRAVAVGVAAFGGRGAAA